jgi:CheY-like chemotaxis protein
LTRRARSWNAKIRPAKRARTETDFEREIRGLGAALSLQGLVRLSCLRMRLLLVEDSPRLQRSLVTALKRVGYVVDVTGDGEEGLWLARSRLSARHGVHAPGKRRARNSRCASIFRKMRQSKAIAPYCGLFSRMCFRMPRNTRPQEVKYPFPRRIAPRRSFCALQIPSPSFKRRICRTCSTDSGARPRRARHRIARVWASRFREPARVCSEQNCEPTSRARGCLSLL